MKVVGRIFWGIITFIILVLLSYNVYRFVCINMLRKDLAPIGGYALLEVASGSMEPEFYKGDLIIINTKDTKYNKDDIITYHDPTGMMITHRIVDINKEEMITKGDNNNTSDKPIDPSNVIGKYVFKISNGKKIINAFKKPIVIFLIILDGILFSIFMSIDSKGNVKLDDDEKEYEEFREYLDKKKK